MQAEHDFTLETQALVHNGKLRLEQEFAQKEKDLDIQQRMYEVKTVVFRLLF
jgi:hypothetical protein